MKSNVALAISIACAAVAVGIVSVDLAFTLTSSLELREDGRWATLQMDPYAETSSRPKAVYGPGCAVNDLRIRLDNNRPVEASADVLVRYSSTRVASGKLLEETWTLAAFTDRTFEFKVPDSAFPAPTTSDPNPQVQVEAFLTADYPFTTCVVRGS